MFLIVFPILVLFGASLQPSNGQVFNPIHYGAKGDGISDDTAAVRAALAAAASNNGGEVLFDAPFAFLTGCFNVTSNVILNVKGTILASQDSSNYVQIEPLPWYGGGQDAQLSGNLEWQPVVRSYKASNITITGGGTIDGQGAPWWTCLHRGNDSEHLVGAPCNGISRPNLIMLVYTTDVTIYDITLKDSPSWTTHLAYCTNVHISHVTVLAPWDSPNTDGFDIDCCVNVLLENSFYSGGDDAIAVQSGMDYFGRTFGRTTENVIIRNMTIERSHGLSIGSEMSAGIRNVTFENISVNGSDAGVKIKSQRGRGAFVQNVTYTNIRLYNVK
uniref:Glycoside hydrolase family 28 protein n=1 Tax=Plectus sambesii TaxID=2011161 RepID=A0A914X7P5_9BILA